MMHPNQVSTGENRRLFISLQHPRPRPALAFRPGKRRPRRGPHRKIRFQPDQARLSAWVLPPAMRARQPLEPARPLSFDERLAAYAAAHGVEGAARPGPQWRRLAHKAGHAQARTRGR
jgi:hypothetical protein